MGIKLKDRTLPKYLKGIYDFFDFAFFIYLTLEAQPGVHVVDATAFTLR